MRLSSSSARGSRAVFWSAAETDSGMRPTSAAAAKAGRNDTLIIRLIAFIRRFVRMTRPFFRVTKNYYASCVPLRADTLQGLAVSTSIHERAEKWGQKDEFHSDFSAPMFLPFRKVIYHLGGKPLTSRRAGRN